MTKKRVLSILLSAMLLSSCTSGTDTIETDTTVSTETIETETVDPATVHDIPADLRYNGAEFHILSAEGRRCFSEELNGEGLNDAQYNMKLHTEELLDVQITEGLNAGGMNELQAAAQSLVLSGDNTYDVFSIMDRFALAMAQEGNFLPITSLEHIDLTKAYWGGDLSAALTVGGTSYFAVGSFQLTSYYHTAVVFMNAALAADNNIELPYEEVYNGTWTFDDMLSYEGIATTDADGNGIMNANDYYTYGSGNVCFIGHMLLAGADMKMVRKDQDDIPYITIYGDEKFISILDMVYNTFLHGENSYFSTMGWADDRLNSNFAAGHTLFELGYFTHITSYRDMEDNFGVLPVPKYDENQEKYYARTYDSFFSVVPITAKDPSMSSAVLEVLSCYGYNHVVPAFVETSLQNKYSRDKDSVRSIQIAFDARTIDIGEACLYDYFGGGGIWHGLLEKNTLNIASWLKSNEKAAARSMEKYIGFMLTEQENE